MQMLTNCLCTIVCNSHFVQTLGIISTAVHHPSLSCHYTPMDEGPKSDLIVLNRPLLLNE